MKDLGKLFKSFLIQDERGSITLLMLVLFIGILLLTGFALDLAKYESQRADLQSAVDRSVLAVASLRHEVPKSAARPLVERVVATRSLSDEPATITLEDDFDQLLTLNGREFAAQANFEMDTDFLRMMGMSQMDVQAVSRAIETKTNVEISMVLDISGTMRWNDDTRSPAEADRRISKLKPAAQQFIDTVTANGTNPNVTVNIIPYAGNVNPGREMFEMLGGVRYLSLEHAQDELKDPSDLKVGDVVQSENGIRVGVGAWFQVTEDESQTASSCLELRADDFPSRGGQSWEEWGQAQMGETPVHDPLAGLPDGGFAQVPHFNVWGFSNSENVLMDWGWCPQDAQEDGDGTMAIKYMSSDAESLKEYLGDLMLHDGTATYIGMKYGLALLNPTESTRINSLTSVNNAFPDRPAPWDDEDTIKVIVLMTDGMYNGQWRPSVPLDTVEDVVIPRSSSEPGEETGAIGSGSPKISGLSSNSDIDDAYDDVCDAAKALGVTVYTIAFDAPGGPANQMRRCATSESHFYDIDLLEIGSAFNSIATSIQRLKLVM